MNSSVLNQHLMHPKNCLVKTFQREGKYFQLDSIITKILNWKSETINLLKKHLNFSSRKLLKIKLNDESIDTIHLPNLTIQSPDKFSTPTLGTIEEDDNASTDGKYITPKCPRDTEKTPSKPVQFTEKSSDIRKWMMGQG